METRVNKLRIDASQALNYWKQIPLEDIDALMLYQKTEQSIGDFLSILEGNSATEESEVPYIMFEWSISVRDFTVLLRDCLLGVAKHEHYKKDDKSVNEDFLVKIQQTIQEAARQIEEGLTDQKVSKEKLQEWKFQKSPALVVCEQLKELQKQCKKVSRSISKVDDVRSNIGEYVRDFQLQYSIQTSAIGSLFTIVEDIKKSSSNVSQDSPDIKIINTVDQIGNKIQDLEHIQSTESIDILPYPDKEILTLPVSTLGGKLRFKSINIKSEFERWFSSFIYPSIIELESKRDHAVEKCLVAFRQIQNKIAALQLAESSTSGDVQKEFEVIFKHLEKEALVTLRTDEKANHELVNNQISTYLKASNVYSDSILFLPESSGNQITNISKDAQRRIINNLDTYRNNTVTFVNKVLSRYIEVDQTSFIQYIKNKLTINDKDDSLALFLKNGYLGKSFTVQRPEIMNPIVEDYRLWNEGFSGAILLTGRTGSGKSTIIGMLSHLGLNEEIIQLKARESYFIQHRSYEPISDLKELVDIIIKRTLGRRVIVCIDDLEQWHDENTDLFDNIIKLTNSISKHRKKIFFVVSCSTFLKDRIQGFLNLDPIFSSQIAMPMMNSNQIKMALNLRAKVKNSGYGKDSAVNHQLGNILRESQGNPGAAMLEHCRMCTSEYKPNVKSQEFTKLMKSKQTLLSYISSYHHISIKFLTDSLSDLDFRNTMQTIDHLVSQKVLIRPKKGYISLNPLLIHTIERKIN